MSSADLRYPRETLWADYIRAGLSEWHAADQKARRFSLADLVRCLLAAALTVSGTAAARHLRHSDHGQATTAPKHQVELRLPVTVTS